MSRLAPAVGMLLGVALVAVPVATTTPQAQASSRSPRVVTLQDTRIGESSGLSVSRTHRNLAWTVNDSGSAPLIYGVSTRTGRTMATVRLAGIDLRDAEALASGTDTQGRPWLVVADIGDNRAVRSSVVLRFLREPEQVRSATVPVVSLRLRYPEGPQDAETLIWQADGRLLVVTKALLTSRVYEVPAQAVATALSGQSVSEPVAARQVATIAQTLATDGAALPDGQLVVRGYQSAVTYRWADDGTLVPTSRLDLPSQPQGETVAVEPGGATLLVGSEGVRQPLWRVRLVDAVRLEAGPPTASAAPDLSAAPSPSSEQAETPAASASTPGTSSAPGARDEVTGRAPRPQPAAAVQPERRTPLAGVVLALVASAVVALGALRGARRRSRRTP